MRVISGKYRGLVLSEFKGMEIRPTADRVKESLLRKGFPFRTVKALFPVSPDDEEY